MEQTQLVGLHRRLEQDRERLRAEIDQIQNESVNAESQYDPEFSGYGNHMAETGTEIYEQERSLALERNLQQQLGEVEHALQKFDAGTYGVCDNCGQDINPERLEALPQAALCIKCRSLLEARQQ